MVSVFTAAVTSHLHSRQEEGKRAKKRVLARPLPFNRKTIALLEATFSRQLLTLTRKVSHGLRYHFFSSPVTPYSEHNFSVSETERILRGNNPFTLLATQHEYAPFFRYIEYYIRLLLDS